MYFFFSSIRRHTRSKRDWSSDVCSSDLSWAKAATTASARRPAEAAGCSARSTRSQERSEERRVGKECRARWWPDHSKKKKCSQNCHDRECALRFGQDFFELCVGRG